MIIVYLSVCDEEDVTYKKKSSKFKQKKHVNIKQKSRYKKIYLTFNKQKTKINIYLIFRLSRKITDFK